MTKAGTKLIGDALGNLVTGVGKERIDYVILAIEGAHVFNSGLQMMGRTADETEVLMNVDRVKKWDNRLFYIGMAHHFDNELVGHAKSLTGLVSNLEVEYPDETIPLLVSHGAATGLKSSSDLVGDDILNSGKFQTYDINFYDDEIVRIGKSGGLFGIQFDERRLGSKEEIRNCRTVYKRERPGISEKEFLNCLKFV